MRSTLLLLAALLLAPHQTKAQGLQGVSGLGLGGSRIVFSPTDHGHPTEADIASLRGDPELQTYLRFINATTIVAQDGYTLYDSNDCDRNVSCLAITSERTQDTIIFPFATEGGLGTTRILPLFQAVKMVASREQIEALPQEIQQRLRIEDGTLLAGNGYNLYTSSTASGTPNCTVSHTTCSIVDWEQTFILYPLRSGR